MQKPVVVTALDNFIFHLPQSERQKSRSSLPLDEGFTLAMLNLCTSVGCGPEARRLFDWYRAEVAHVPVGRNDEATKRAAVVGGVRRPKPACYHAAIHACVGVLLARCW